MPAAAATVIAVPIDKACHNHTKDTKMRVRSQGLAFFAGIIFKGAGDQMAAQARFKSSRSSSVVMPGISFSRHSA